MKPRSATVISFLLLLGVAYLVINRPKQDINLQSEKLRQKINVSANKHWEKISAFKEVTKEKVDATKDAIEFMQFATDAAKKILKCLPENYCGAEASASGYFDPENTPAHKTLENILDQFEDRFDQFDVPKYFSFQQVLEMLEVKSERVQKAALRLATKYPERDQLIHLGDELQGQAAATYYNKLSSLLPEQFKPSLVRSAAETFSKKDPHTVILILEGAPNLAFDERSWIDLVKPLCTYAEKPEEKHNWLAMQKNLKDMAKNLGINSEPLDHCR